MSNLLSMKSFAKTLNDATFTDYYLRLKMLAKSRFKWEGLPPYINEKYIENFLFKNGKCVFYMDPEKGLMVAECVEDGSLNNFEEPVSVSPTGIEITPQSLTPGETCVIIHNNDEDLATSFVIKLFAYRLAEISRTIDVNLNAQKTPYIIVSNDKQLLTLKNIYTKVEGNEAAVFVDKNLDLDQVKVLSTNAPVVFPELQEQKQNIWNECLTFMGINNANTDKRERLISTEVEANNIHIDLSAECFLKARQEAAEKINKIFGTNIKVSLREVEKECMQDIQKP